MHSSGYRFYILAKALPDLKFIENNIVNPEEPVPIV